MNPEQREIRPAQDFVAIIKDEPSQDIVLDTGIITMVGNNLDPCMIGDHVRYAGTAKEIHYMGQIITRYSNVVGNCDDA